jgi:hypothetical protein
MSYEKATKRKPVKRNEIGGLKPTNYGNKEKNENGNTMKRNGNTTKHGRKCIKTIFSANVLVSIHGILPRPEISDLKLRYNDGKIISLRFNPLRRMRKWIYYCCGNRVMFRGRHPRDWRRIFQRRIFGVL